MNSSKNNKYLGVDLNLCKFIGKGYEGKVYLLPDEKRVIKVYKSPKGCRGEAKILLSVDNNPYFPRIYAYNNICMIREYVPGICITKYLKTHELSRKLAINIVKLIESFKSEGFKKLDIRCAHIFVQPDESLKVIDPRRVFEKKISYPRSILETLKKSGHLQQFMEILKEEYPELHKKWGHKYKKHR
ncbi:serine/threonine protein kinase [Clostridium sp. MSJ-4]|uniref:Serine/threonine protein kinase n=1 Tax=Clostridium simiarum TaxID=2841506 RepID=A0ABS6F066_9CLOT|nr:serine/threonine protein kinase [Clostridium simiarum]MBU5591886.1 serine/threonine protein kinase [Clostridium simiarum]